MHRSGMPLRRSGGVHPTLRVESEGLDVRIAVVTTFCFNKRSTMGGALPCGRWVRFACKSTPTAIVAAHALGKCSSISVSPISSFSRIQQVLERPDLAEDM